MKKLSLLTLCVAMAILADAATRTVNNNFTSPGQFTTIAAAITAANVGDTILIHGSPVNYNSFTINKQLVFFGTGHNPQTNNTNRCYMGDIFLASGSTGSKFFGLDMDYMHPTVANIANIFVSRCRINGYVYANGLALNNWTFESCYFLSSGSRNIDLDNATVSNFYVRNCIFNGWIEEFYVNNSNVYFMNNIMLYNGNFLTFYGANINFYNNIYYRASPSTGTNWPSNNVWDKNVSYQCSNNTFSNGINYTNTNPLFTNFPAGGAYFSYTHDFNLQVTSTVKNGGNDGTDPGVYGGTVVFNQNGIPAIPYIKSLNITGPTTVPANGTLNISVKGKVNQ
jgi:hypothetical protein